MKFILLGESASGKSTIEKEIQKYGFYKIVSYTTRDIRPGERPDIDYHYISDEMFNSLKNNGFFAETAVYNGWNYGTAKEDCTDDKVAVVTPHGMRQLNKIDGLNIKSFYINVPRRDRLIKILQRGDKINEAIRRNLSDIGQYDGIKDEVNFVIDNDGYKKTVNRTVSQCVNSWIEIYKFGKIKDASYDRIESTFNSHINGSDIGKTKLSKLKTIDLQIYFNQKSNSLSYSSVKKIYEILNPCFRHAVLVGDMSCNPMEGVKMPNRKMMSIKTKTIEIYTDEEVEKLEYGSYHYFAENPRLFRYAPIFIFLLNTGLRAGEVLAFKWSDVDFTSKTVVINEKINPPAMLGRIE